MQTALNPNNKNSSALLFTVSCQLPLLRAEGSKNTASPPIDSLIIIACWSEEHGQSVQIRRVKNFPFLLTYLEGKKILTSPSNGIKNELVIRAEINVQKNIAENINDVIVVM